MRGSGKKIATLIDSGCSTLATAFTDGSNFISGQIRADETWIRNKIADLSG